jgi:hypothetical protein
VNTAKNKGNCTNSSVNISKNKGNHTILIIGDSHIRGYATILKHNFDETYNVIRIVKPGADIMTLSNSVKDTTSTLGKNDALVFSGGANNISKKQLKTRTETHLKFCKKNTQTNIVLLGIPHRHDLVNWSCVNNEIITFNRKLFKSMKCHEHVKVMNCEVNRQFFTRQGMYLNKLGKEVVIKHITATCESIFQSNKNLTSISLLWEVSVKFSTNLQADKYPVTNGSEKVIEEQEKETVHKPINGTIEQENETVRKSSRLKNQVQETRIFYGKRILFA